MITFMKGDKTQTISLALAEGFDYSGKTIHLEYQGARRSFSGVAAGATLSFSFTAEETASMSLGTYPVRVWIEGEGGEHVTVHNGALKLRVTDSPSEARGASAMVLDVKGGLHGIEGLPERYTDKDMRDKVNEILRRLGGTVAAFALAILPAFGATVDVQTAPKGTIYNDEQVVTNVVLDVSDLVTTGQLATAVGAISALDASLSSRLFRASSAATNYTDAATNTLAAAMTAKISSATNGLATAATVNNLVSLSGDRLTVRGTQKTLVTRRLDSRSGETAIDFGFDRTGQVGQYSAIFGNACEASGFCSFAGGYQARATQNFAFAFGCEPQANNLYAFAVGQYTEANAYNSFACGRYATVQAPHYNAFAWSGVVRVGRYYSHGEGTFNIDPIGGAAGFWIGETNLSDYVHNVAASVVGSAGEKRVAMFILPLNFSTNETYMCVELKATTNNFATGSQRDKTVYYSHTASLDLSTADGALAFVENFGDTSYDARSYMSVADASDPDVLETLPRSPAIVVIVSVQHCRRTDGSWLSDQNENLLWTYARGTFDSCEAAGPGRSRAMWRPCAPVRWFSQVPRWATE